MYGPSARMRLEQQQEEEQRSSSAVVITSILSLLVVVAAVAVVAWLVLRSPAPAVDSAERLDPVGTALPAPTEQPALPTPLPTEPPVATQEPESELPASANNQTQQEAPANPPAVVGLPTVVAEELDDPAGPTPTPRVIAQPTEIPPTPVPAAPTLPPSIPVTEVPVVALQPVEQAPPVATIAPARDQNSDQVVSQPTPAPAANDDDPFNIFDDVAIPRIDPAQDPMDRVREMQEERENNDSNQVIVPSNGNGTDDNDRQGRNRDDRETSPVIGVPAGGTNDSPAVVASMPDVDAMIDEITASTIDRVTNPSTNPNTRSGGRRITTRDDDNDKKTPTAGSNTRRKTTRDKNRAIQSRDDEDSAIMPRLPRPGANRDNDDCSIGDPGFPFC